MDKKKKLINDLRKLLADLQELKHKAEKIINELEDLRTS